MPKFFTRSFSSMKCRPRSRSRFDGKFEPRRAGLMLQRRFEGLEGRFKVWRSDLRLRGLIKRIIRIIRIIGII